MTTATRDAYGILPLENGAHLSAQEFMERYEVSEPGLKAELIDGVVYLASPVSIDHSEQHAPLVTWLGVYAANHPDVKSGDNGTLRLGPNSAPQPDAYLRFKNSRQNRQHGKYLEGAPELVAEVAVSSASIDLHGKLEVYRTNGVREYIVWRVHDLSVDWFMLTEGQYVRLQPDDRGVIHSLVFPGLRLAVQALIDGDMATVLATQMEPDA